MKDPSKMTDGELLTEYTSHVSMSACTRYGEKKEFISETTILQEEIRKRMAKVPSMNTAEQIEYFKTKHPLGCSGSCETKGTCPGDDAEIVECMGSV